MLKTMLVHWNAHRLGFSLLLFGYLIAILVMSIGVSWVQDARHEIIGLSEGYPDIHVLEISMIELNERPHEQIINTIAVLEEPPELHIQYFYLGVEDYEGASVLSVFAEERPDWLPPLLKGRHLTQDETVGSERLAVIGKNVAKRLFPEGINENAFIDISDRSFSQESGEVTYDKISVMRYQVIGTIGHDQRTTIWDDNIYIPQGTIPRNLIMAEEESMVDITLIQDNRFAEREADLLMEKLKINSPSIHYVYQSNEPKNFSDHNVWMNAMAIMVITGLILLVSMVNVINLTLFWVLERRKEIVIQKAIGATDRRIMGSILMESIAIALVAACIAVAGHYLYAFLFSTSTVTWINWLFAVGTALVCGVFTSIIPTRMALSMQPAEVLSSE